MTVNGYLILIAYLLGSLPFALWIGKWVKGIDISETGSKNMGASNVFREIGPAYGVIVLILDMLKEYLAVALSAFIDSDGWMGTEKGFWQLMLGGIAIVGHLFPLFAGFRGGKGVACLFGMVLAIQPWIALICVVVFLAVVGLTRYISIGSLAGVVVFMLCVWFAFKETDQYIRWFSVASAGIILVMHRKNLLRVWHGTERKVNIGKKNSTDK